MTAKWTVLHTKETFVAAVKKRRSALLLEVQNSVTDTDRFEKANEQWEEFLKFSTTIENFLDGATDPFKAMRPARDKGEIIPEYFVLRVNKWSGYYRVDPVETICIGVLIHHDDDEAFAELARALGDAFKKFLAQRGK